MLASALTEELKRGSLDKSLALLYPSRVDLARQRIEKLASSFLAYYGDMEVCLISVPGRAEIAGNHTDRMGGVGIGAAIDTDIVALAARTDDNLARIKSDGYREDIADLSSSADEVERRRSASAVITGVAEYFRRKKLSQGGFCAYTDSDIMIGSGLSSSAAFEVLCAKIFSVLYNGNGVSPYLLSAAGQYAENNFFGKPCGMFDQLSCAHGGAIFMDFSTDIPRVESIEFAPERLGFTLCTVDTGGSHSSLVDDYTAITNEMRTVAALMGKKSLIECDENDFLGRIGYLRSIAGDRAILRVMHFFDENRRVLLQKSAIDRGDFDEFLALVAASGDSSAKLLENVITPKRPDERGIPLALALTERQGAVGRVHGGGFAGTIMAFVSTDRVSEYSKAVSAVFGEGSCRICKIRPYGAVVITENGID